VGAPPVDGHEDPPYFAGYPGKISYVAGDTLQAHIATRSKVDCFVDVYRVIGCVPGTFTPRLEHVHRIGRFRPTRYPQRKDKVPLAPGNSDEAGCGWQAIDLMAIPAEWPSGVYLLQFTAAESPTNRASPRLGEDCYFILRQARPGSVSPVLFQVGVATWNAYHVWQNRSLYVAVDRAGVASYDLRAGRVSFHRPGVGLGCLNEVAWWPGKGRQYLLPFLEWVTETGQEFEYCTGLDIGDGTVSLSNYKLVVTIGHDEYWTGPQRSAFDEFIARGGNAAFFGGNMAYWQVRPTPDGTAFDCHKRTDQFSGEPLDPAFPRATDLAGSRREQLTTQFDATPIDWPPTRLLGGSWHNSGDAPGFDGGPVDFRWAGATWWWEQTNGPERPPLGFTVLKPQHWSLEGTGLALGEAFGAEQKLVGYECDGLDVVWKGDVPSPAPDMGVPPSFEFIAYADCRDWPEYDYADSPPTHRPGAQINSGASAGIAPILSWRSPGGGEVFTAGTTDWVHALVPTLDYTRYKSLIPHINPQSEAVRTITANVIRRLGRGA
jgi:hypothetical protein